MGGRACALALACQNGLLECWRRGRSSLGEPDVDDEADVDADDAESTGGDGGDDGSGSSERV